MSPTVFLTGGGGFVGARLLDAFSRRGDTVVALDRSGTILRHAKRPGEIQVLAGDLLDGRTYQQALSRADVVVHLASTTGKASEQEHFRIIGSGTAALIEQCQRAGVRKLLYVSSIAASFPDVRHYPYAQAKLRAEELVRSSGLNYAILRPTMILGPGSPILGALEKLARLRVIPVFGTGRTRVQPVFVDDVVQFILTVLDDDLFTGQTFDVGGPSVLTVQELLQMIRATRTRSQSRTVHVPLGPVLGTLHAAEAVGLGSALPIGAGQLSTFQHDGTVTSNILFERCRPMLRTTAQTLSLSVTASEQPTETDVECVVFSSYLLGCSPDANVRRKYAAAHAVMDGLVPRDPFDAYLLRFASKHRFCTKLADAYARVFRPGAALHRKLILLLAILECCPPSYRMVDAPVAGPRALLAIRLPLRVCAALFALVVATLVLSPARLALANRRAQAALSHD